jgi:hypothetical protein
MSKKTLGILLIAFGLLLAVVSLTADVIGLGNGSGFGWEQITGSIVGVLLVAGGAWWGWGKTGTKKS